MKLRKVISGGQTGADTAGLLCARVLGLETGGTAPKGFRTEVGPNPELAELGLIESASEFYPSRTRANVMEADATLWFGNTGSPGFVCTARAARQLNRPFYTNPTADMMRRIAQRYEVINIAGNRASKNPEVVALVEAAFDGLSPDGEDDA